jgi:hypothetical protein
MTLYGVFCNVNHVAFPAEEKTAKCKCKQWFDVHGVSDFCVFIAVMSTIQNPASLSP